MTNIPAPGEPRELQLSVGLLFAHQQIPLGAPHTVTKIIDTIALFRVVPWDSAIL